MASSPRFFSTSVRLDGFLDVILLLALSGSWLALLGSWHWALDLFSHFRLQYLVIGALALIWSLLRKRRGVMWVTFATLLLNLFLVGRLSLPSPASLVTKGEPLRILCFNVLTGNPNKQGVLDYLLASEADVILVLEVDSRWAEALEPLKQTYPHHFVRSEQGNFGNSLFSRLPLGDPESVDFGQVGIASITTTLRFQDRDFILIGTHPVPPMGPAMTRRRNAQLASIGEWVGRQTMPVLVMGDLNSTPWCQGTRLLTTGNSLAYRSSTPAWVPTWSVARPYAIPIDHALCTPPLIIPSRRIGQDLGSDHRPQELQVQWEL